MTIPHLTASNVTSKLRSSSGSLNFLTRGGLVGLCAILVALVFPSFASAHSAEGTMTITKSEQVGPNRVHVEVGIAYAGDEHLATDAAVSATLTSSTGDVVGPVTLNQVSADSSLYEAEVDVTGPGTWTVAAKSTDPTASATAAIEVTATEESTTSTTSTSTTTSAPESEKADNGAVGGTISTEDSPEKGSAAEDESSDSDNTAILIGLGVLAVIIIGGFALVLRKKSGSDSDGDSSEGGTSDTPQAGSTTGSDSTP
ncbi:MAG TPA: hypothetical protein VL068_00740 [Microthrixaceae bacterium]|nr:hypothetical protein [Microthrixaceae bacterium]